MDLLEQFKEYLLSQDKKASKITVKNYLSDVNHFIRWYESANGKTFEPSTVTRQTIEAYKQNMINTDDQRISADNLRESVGNQCISPRSMERHLSSLRKFFKFLKLEGHISLNPFEQFSNPAIQQSVDPYRLRDFKSYLYVFNASHLTIKNYLIDIKQFLNWAKEVLRLNDSHDLSANNLFKHISGNLLEEYKTRLINEGTFSITTINRKLSSLRKYIAWAESEGLISQNQELRIMNYELEKKPELQQFNNEAIKQ